MWWTFATYPKKKIQDTYTFVSIWNCFQNVREGIEWKKELGMIGLDHFLSTQNTTHQLSALNFLEHIIPRLKDSDCINEILDYCDVIETLSQHSSSACRDKALDIMKWIYDAFRPPFVGKDKTLKEKLANQSRICLIRGKLRSHSNNTGHFSPISVPHPCVTWQYDFYRKHSSLKTFEVRFSSKIDTWHFGELPSPCVILWHFRDHPHSPLLL